MLPNKSPYNRFMLCKDMLEAPDIVRNFDEGSVLPFIQSFLLGCGNDADEKRTPIQGFFLTGEGSSRIFPAKRAIYDFLRNPRFKGLDRPISLYTEGATQALEYDLSSFVVIGASNSGKTKEVIRLLQILKSREHSHLYGITTYRDAPLCRLCRNTYTLRCGPEGAVAATKSVIEQALFYQALFYRLQGKKLSGTNEAGKKMEAVLKMQLDSKLVERIAGAETLYIGGRNNGVAEELTLKTNEITRKQSDFLEGTYAVHGIEEVMNPQDAVILIDPFPEEEEKFADVLVRGVGAFVCAIASRDTSFPTIRIPNDPNFKNYLELTAGWNLLVEIGIQLGIDLDKPVRARKVGNEAIPIE